MGNKGLVQRLGDLSTGGKPWREGGQGECLCPPAEDAPIRQMLTKEILTFLWGPWVIIGKPPEHFFFFFQTADKVWQLWRGNSTAGCQAESQGKFCLLRSLTQEQWRLKWLEKLANNTILQKSKIVMISPIRSSKQNLDFFFFSIGICFMHFRLLSAVNPRKFF